MSLDASTASPADPTPVQTGRQRLAMSLDDWSTPLGVTVNGAIAALILLSAAIFVAETYELSETALFWLNWVDNACLVVFVVEYLVRFSCAESKRAFVLNPYALLDLVAIVPFLIGWVDVRFLRLFRWLRILRLFRFLQLDRGLGQTYSANVVIFARILFTLFAIIFVYSGLIYQVEHPVNGTVFRHFVDAFYFSAVTMTTVGFGDVTPVSDLGRLLTVLMILTGVAVIPWQLGELIQQVLKTTHLGAAWAAFPPLTLVCPTCNLDRHEADARFCRRCGTRLPDLVGDRPSPPTQPSA